MGNSQKAKISKIGKHKRSSTNSSVGRGVNPTKYNNVPLYTTNQNCIQISKIMPPRPINIKVLKSEFNKGDVDDFENIENSVESERVSPENHRKHTPPVNIQIMSRPPIAQDLIEPQKQVIYSFSIRISE